MSAKLVLQDRTLATKWAVTIDDGEMLFTATALAIDAEPIFEDLVNAGTYWKLFIDDGMMAVESTVTVQDDEILLTDATLGQQFKLFVGDGMYYYSVNATGNGFVLKPEATLIWELKTNSTQVLELKTGVA